MFATIAITICALVEGARECRQFTQETTASIAECEAVIDQYELYIVGQLISSNFPHPLLGVDAECVTSGDPACCRRRR